MKSVLAFGVCCVALTASLIAQTVPAFAEKVTLACSYDSTQYVTVYLMIDTDAKTVKVNVSPGSKENGTYRARITDDAVTWVEDGGRNTYDRQTAQFEGWMNNFGRVCNPPCLLPRPAGASPVCSSAAATILVMTPGEAALNPMLRCMSPFVVLLG